jgi:hypothetical protein
VYFFRIIITVIIIIVVVIIIHQVKGKVDPLTGNEGPEEE